MFYVSLYFLYISCHGCGVPCNLHLNRSLCRVLLLASGLYAEAEFYAALVSSGYLALVLISSSAPVTEDLTSCYGTPPRSHLESMLSVKF